MRVFGRLGQINGQGGTWTEVDTDENGDNSVLYLVALSQCIKLDRAESPFYANFGIPARQAVITQVFPDYYVAQTQAQYASFFASLIINRVQGTNPPVYTGVAVTNAGAVLPITVPT